MIVRWALAVSGLALLAVIVATAQRAAVPIPERSGFLDRWRRGHGDYDPGRSRVVGGWLTVVYACARPLATAGVRPDALTAATAWLGAAAVALAAEGGGWPVLAGALVVTAGLGDALDGAVAVLTDRATRWGYVLDSVVDRVTDLLFVAALWVAGAPGLLAAGTGAGVLLLEYARARAATAGAGQVGTVTVGERPSRVIAVAATLVAVGIAADRASAAATAGLWVLAALTVAGLLQLLVALHRALAPDGPPAS